MQKLISGCQGPYEVKGAGIYRVGAPIEALYGAIGLYEVYINFTSNVLSQNGGDPNIDTNIL